MCVRVMLLRGERERTREGVRGFSVSGSEELLMVVMVVVVEVAGEL